MAMKKGSELFIKDGEYHAPALRGAFEQWADKDWTMLSDREVKIKVRDDHTEWVNCFRNFESWLDQKLDDSWYGDVKQEYGNDEPKEIFHDYWESNDEFREEIKSHVEYVTVGGDPGTDPSDGDSSDSDGDEDDDKDKSQSSFGESQFPKLYELDVVDDEGRMHRAKLRGLVVAFVKDVDAIRGESGSFEVIEAQRAFLYWAKDKFGKEWIEMMKKYQGTDYIYDAVSYVYSSKDDIAEQMELMYVGGRDMDPGNPDTDDLLKQFLDSEAPGWNEEDDNNEEGNSTDKWQEYEQEAQEKYDDGQGREEKEDTEDEGSKWDEFEQQSKEKYDGQGGALREVNETSGSEASGSDGSANDSVGDNPGTIDEWTQKQGKADPDEFKGGKSRQERVSQSSISNGNGAVKSGKAPTGAGETTVECEDGGRPHEIKWPEVGRMDELEKSRIYEGNTYEWAMKLPKDSIDTIVTSPPYYALRDYDIEDAYPISGDFTCDHNWDNEFCTDCGAFLGQLGHEPDPATFVEHVVDLMDRYKEVLKPSGSLWLNIGDTYAGEDIDGRVKAKNKSRMMIPERIYRRMVQTGWHLRDYVVWVKKIWMPDDDLRGNGKPFASSSRLADQWEPMVRFTPSPDGYSDVDSNRLTPPSFDGDLGTEGVEGKFRKGEDTQRGKTYNSLGTNPPDVWLINSDGYDGDHRAVFPEQLPERCINITTPDRVCDVCGRPFDKEVHVEEGKKLSAGGDYATYERRCHHESGHEPGVAFDPFLGSGTTAVAAANSGFNWAGVELSEKYAELARKRIPRGLQAGLDQY